MQIEQFVMAYRIDQDRIRAMLPDGFVSLRPVLRINTELRKLADSEDDYNEVYVEFNTPVEAYGRRGWLNIANWQSPADSVSRTYEKQSLTAENTAAIPCEQVLGSYIVRFAR